MERSVRLHLARLRQKSPDGDEACWCPLCRADMMAMALSALPPRYATRRVSCTENEGHLLDVAVHEEVLRAMRHVGKFPKHSTGGAADDGESVWVVNYPLEESFRAVEAMVRAREGACDCWHCRCDIVAFALNRYPARYGVEHQGQIHLPESDRVQMRSELASFLDLALRVVSTVPRHQYSAASA